MAVRTVIILRMKRTYCEVTCDPHRNHRARMNETWIYITNVSYLNYCIGDWITCSVLCTTDECIVKALYTSMTDHECKNLGENKIIPSASYACAFWISWIVSYDTRFKDATHQVWINCKLNAEKLNHMKLQYLDFVNNFLLIWLHR